MAMEKPEEPDYYKVLGLDQWATVFQIKRAFKKLALFYHPDKASMSPHTADHTKFCDIKAAEELLCDPHKRKAYDRRYAEIQLDWRLYEAFQNAKRNRLEEDIRRKAEAHAKEAEARRREEERIAEEARQAEALARRKRKKEEAERRTQEALRRAWEEQRIQAERRHAEQLRVLEEKQKEAEKRSQAAARRAREHQEQAARKRLAEIAAEEQNAARLASIKAREEQKMQLWSKFREKDNYKASQHLHPSQPHHDTNPTQNPPNTPPTHKNESNPTCPDTSTLAW